MPRIVGRCCRKGTLGRRAATLARQACRAFAAIQILCIMAIVSAACAHADLFQLSGNFAVSPTGAAGYTIPIAVPPGTAGMAPSLSLKYSSQAGNGMIGLGWSLDGISSITRCPQTLAQDKDANGHPVFGTVDYTASDRFCLDGQRLILLPGTLNYGDDGAEYRTERNIYSRIISHGSKGGGPAWFEVHTKAGLEMDYGSAPDAPAAQQAKSATLVQGRTMVRVWNLGETKDRVGNYYTVSYTSDALGGAGVTYPSSIDYTGNATQGLQPYNSVKFVYGTDARLDPLPFYRAGSLVQMNQLLTDIQTYAMVQGTQQLVNTYHLDYRQSPATGRSEMRAVTVSDGNGVKLPATTFGWQGTAQPLAGTVTEGAAGYPTSVLGYCEYMGDFSGTGRSDVLVLGLNNNSNTKPGLYRADEHGQLQFDATFVLPDVLSKYPYCGNVEVVTGDWNGDGITDIAITPYNQDLSINPTVFFTTGGTGFTQIWSYQFADPGSAHQAGSSNFQIIPGNFDGTGRSGILVLPSGALGTCNSNPCDAPPARMWLSTPGATNAFTQVSGFKTNSLVWFLGTPLPYIQLGDFDGDGRQDIAAFVGSSVYIYNASDFLTGTFDGKTPSGTLNFPAGYGGFPTFADFNGDGKTDFFLCLSDDGSSPGPRRACDTTNAVFYISKGNGFKPVPFFANSTSQSGDFFADENPTISATQVLIDANGDGIADFASFKLNGNQLADPQIVWTLSWALPPAGWSQPSNWTPPAGWTGGPFIWLTPTVTSQSGPLTPIGDVNGTGVSAVVSGITLSKNVMWRRRRIVRT